MMKPSPLLFYIYSQQNIVGSVLGLVGLIISSLLVALGSSLLLFLIIPTMYLIGALVMPQSPKYQLTFQHESTVEEIEIELNNLLKSTRGRVAKEVMAKIEGIVTSILDILPYIIDINSADSHIFVIRQTALDYLPDMLESYLNLPPAFANLHVVRDGKTAKQILLAQLDMLDQELKEIAQDFHQANTDRLLVHGRFLESKFQRGDLLN